MNGIIKDVGQILYYSNESACILLICENADVGISFYSATIIRVDVSFNRDFEPFSYAVEVEPKSGLYEFEDTGAFLKITTEKLIFTIAKQSFAVTFMNPDGKIINCDEQGLFNSQVENRITAYKTMQTGERFIGLGEKCGGLNKAGTGFTNINTDSFAYGLETDPLYTTFPFYVGLHNSLCYGIFLDNTYQSDFNFGASNNRFSSFGVRGGNLNYYFIYENTVAKIIESYTYLTGRMPLPPLWTLGYHQNRYSYYPDTTVLRIAGTMRENRIPCDSITLDIHYMDEYKLFTWNSERFPNPKELVETLKDKGFKITVIVDPGIKADFAEDDSDIFVKYPDGRDYEGEVWAGWCKFPDFTNPEARKWWHKKMEILLDKGVAGIWNDMNEISTWGQKLPDNLIFHYEGKGASGLKALNIYGLLMARSSYEAYRNFNAQRPFLLTRAAFSGIQKYSAVWTGDNTAQDAHILMNVRMLMGLGITGVAFSGMDVGGFLGEPSTELYIRGMQIGAFIPYMRNHKQINTKASEPWTYGEEAMEIARNYISLRYRLLPYIYSMFRAASRTGMPIIRTLAIEHSFDDNIYSELFYNQYYFGDALMIAPFDSVQKYGEIYFPENEYYNLYNDDFLEFNPSEKRSATVPLSLHTLPVYVRGSSIIPMQNTVMHTGENSGEILYLHVYKGSICREFTYYEDDGNSFDYMNGDFFERIVKYNPLKNSILMKEAQGNLSSKFLRIKLILHGFGDIATISCNNKIIELTSEKISFLEPISAYKPQSSPIKLSECKVKCAEIENIREIIEIKIDVL